MQKHGHNLICRQYADWTNVYEYEFDACELSDSCFIHFYEKVNEKNNR